MFLRQLLILMKKRLGREQVEVERNTHDNSLCIQNILQNQKKSIDREWRQSSIFNTRNDSGGELCVLIIDFIWGFLSLFCLFVFLVVVALLNK